MLNKLLIIVLSVCAFGSITAGQAVAQSCPNVETYGLHSPAARAADETRRVRITGIYFKTIDRSVFIPEGKDLRQSASYIKVSGADFLARLRQLEQQSKASVSSQLSGNLFLGDAAELNLEHDAVNASVDLGELSGLMLNPKRWFDLDRWTEIRVSQASAGDARYSIMLLSSFVEVKDETADVSVDLDAKISLAPGEIAVFKLTGDAEIGRSGPGRTYFALSINPVDDQSLLASRSSAPERPQNDATERSSARSSLLSAYD